MRGRNCIDQIELLLAHKYSIQETCNDQYSSVYHNNSMKCQTVVLESQSNCEVRHLNEKFD